MLLQSLQLMLKKIGRILANCLIDCKFVFHWVYFLTAVGHKCNKNIFSIYAMNSIEVTRSILTLLYMCPKKQPLSLKKADLKQLCLKAIIQIEERQENFCFGCSSWFCNIYRTHFLQIFHASGRDENISCKMHFLFLMAEYSIYGSLIKVPSLVDRIGIRTG